jgi:hypothetical protein
LYDHDDFLCVASSQQQFKLEPDDVRKVGSPRDPLSTIQVLQAIPITLRIKPSEASTDIQVLDGLLTYSRVNDPTFAHGDGPPPTHLKLGKEGKADVKDGGNDQIIAELNERVSPLTFFFCLELTCRYSLLLDRPTMSFSSRVSRVPSRMSCPLRSLVSQRACRVLREYRSLPVDLQLTF